MHELGIAESVLDLVRQYVPLDQANAVRQVTVRVGELAGVVPESLQWSFGAVVAGTPFAGASLTLERVPAMARCRTCGAEFGVGRGLFVCPACKGLRAVLVRGSELQVVDVELA